MAKNKKKKRINSQQVFAITGLVLMIVMFVSSLLVYI